MNIRTLVSAAAAIGAATCIADGNPSVSVTSVQQDSSRAVTVNYTLSGAAAIVTLDVYTNGVAISQENVWSISGDANQLVEPGDRTLVWHPDKSWPNMKFTNGEVSFGVTAWSKDDPPMYMAANLVDKTVKYYTSEAGVPGGVTENPIYKTSVVLLRRIYAKDIPWMMGSAASEPGRWTDGRETQHEVTLTHDYYIGVFPVTQKQWWYVKNSWPSYYNNVQYREGRPVESVSFKDIRGAHYPSAAEDNSFLSVIGGSLGIAFDLPTNAQWEYACRANHGDGLWGDGSVIKADMQAENFATENDPNFNRLGRNPYNGGTGATANNNVAAAKDSSDEYGTPTVGSYDPNSWGLYDMHGGVWEICLDSYNVNSTVYGDGVYTKEANTVVRGGCLKRAAARARSAFYASNAEDNKSESHGFRLAVTLP